jgi:hypothetical protein
MANKWMQHAVSHPGALHRTLGIPQGRKIPMSAIKSAEHSSNPLTRKRAFLAETFRHAHHASRGQPAHK